MNSWVSARSFPVLHSSFDLVVSFSSPLALARSAKVIFTWRRKERGGLEKVVTLWWFVRLRLPLLHFPFTRCSIHISMDLIHSSDTLPPRTNPQAACSLGAPLHGCLLFLHQMFFGMFLAVAETLHVFSAHGAECKEFKKRVNFTLQMPRFRQAFKLQCKKATTRAFHVHVFVA